MPKKNLPQKFYLIAGESSGDNIGANLIKEIKNLNPEAQFYGIGGNNMLKEGLKVLFPSKEISVMGFAEVIPSIFRILKLLKSTKKDILKINPDVIITIDAPGFNFRLIERIKDFTSAKKVHYIAPTVWAYKAHRAKIVAGLYDLLLVILPFEAQYFLKEGLATKYVGYSHLENFKIFPKEDFCFKYNINREDILLSITPGSRKQEIKTLLPIFLEAVEILQRKYSIKFKIAILMQKDLKEEIKCIAKGDYIFVDESDKQLLFSAADLALSKSGTISMELAFYKKPFVVAHKINWLSFFLIKNLIKIPYVSIINIIAGETLIPELLQKDCNPEKISDELYNMWKKEKSENWKQKISCNIDSLKTGNISPSKKAAKAIFNLFS